MKIDIVFDLERETKGTFRFKEREPAPGHEPAIGTIYVRKSTFTGEAPKALKVTLTDSVK